MENSHPIHLMASHEVEDYTTWKQGFDAAATTRDRYGIKIHGVYSDHDNPNMVTVVGEAPSMEAMHGHNSDPEFHATMKSAGVKGAPTMKLLHKQA